MNEWFVGMKSKAIKCKFASSFEDKIKDGFVTGLTSVDWFWFLVLKVYKTDKNYSVMHCKALDIY